MALNFPDSPTLNQIYTDSTSGFSYQWNGSVWISYSASTTNNISELDDISGSFNGSTTIFPLTVGGVAVSPASTNQLLISVGGVMQNPTNDFYISGSNIVFTTAPATGLTFFGTLLGTAIPIGVSTIGDVYNRQTYAVTGVQTDFSFPSGYTVGYLDVFRNGARLIAGNDFTATTGNSFSLNPPAQNTDDVEAIGYKVSTIAVTEGNLTNLIVNQNANVIGLTTLGTGVGAGQTALLVQGNARVTDTLTVGTGLTLSSGGVIAGVVTASSFVGSGSGLTGVTANPVGQTTTSQSPTTTIDLSLGSVIYFDHNTDTTVAFANTATTQELTFIRTKDNSTTARSITWPSNIYWDDIDPPALQNEGASGNTQIFSLTTRNSGVTWSGYQVQQFAGIGTYLYAWAAGSSGQLGLNDTIDAQIFLFEKSTRWKSINNASNTTLATKTDGTLWAWGSGASGRLGQNNTTYRSSPVQIPGTQWNSINSSSSHLLATKTDNTLWSWGNNQGGTLGQNNATQYSSPVQIPGTTWSSISGGNSHSLATKTGGTLWTWGPNLRGQLGQNNTTYRSSPIQIPGTTWSSISAGDSSSLATKTDNTLWAWGFNTFGRLGQNNQTYYSSPVQIPGTTWSSIAAGRDHSLATKTDNTLWAWGRNNSGELGQNSTSTALSSPVQIPGTTWSSINAGSQFSLANKTDGTLWAWGTNNTGRLGPAADAVTEYSSPVQIPGTQWTLANVRIVGSASFAFKTIT